MIKYNTIKNMTMKYDNINVMEIKSKIQIDKGEISIDIKIKMKIK